jgi:hypothetical protein
MTSERKNLPLTIVIPLLAALVAGCGNYSNEDLEFMNALPQGDALRAEMPAVSPALSPEDEAELAKMTHDTTRGFNAWLGGLVSMVDLVRSFPPTSRTRDSRTWGPFEPDRGKLVNRDWQTRMIMRRNLVNPEQFDYEIAFHKIGTSDLDWPVFIRGWFLAGQTARKGRGHVQLVTAGPRAGGMDLTDLGMLDHLEIDYDTSADPVTVDMTITNLPGPLGGEPAMLIYSYLASAAGQGEMTFDVFGNIPGTGAPIEHLNVTSRWRASGEGRAQATIVSGDGQGLQQTQCWSSSFEQTFNDKPWNPAENYGGDPSVCPDIPPL